MANKEDPKDPKLLTKVIDTIFDGQGENERHEVSPFMITPGSRGRMRPRYGSDGLPIDDD